MSKFSNWADKLFVDMDKEMEKEMDKPLETPLEDSPKKEESVEEIEQKIKNMDIGYEKLVKKNGFDPKKHHMYSDIRNKLFRDLTIAKVKHYDVKKAVETPKYISYKESLKDEVAEVDKNEAIDDRLDMLLRDKLDISESKEEKLSKKAKEEMKRRDEAAAERSRAFQDRTSALKNMINGYDTSKRERDPHYLSYEDQCAENEKVSTTDKENYKKFKESSKAVVEDLDKNFTDRLLEAADPDKNKPLSNQELASANFKIEQEAATYVRDICKKLNLIQSGHTDTYYNKESDDQYYINGFEKTYKKLSAKENIDKPPKNASDHHLLMK
jgi:hypothetical protein